MKKIKLIALLFTFSICSSSFGQFNLNFSAGVNQSNCKFEKVGGDTPKSIFGYFFGFGPSLQITDKIQVQVDFQYSLKGHETGDEINSLAAARYGYFDMIPEVEFYIKKYLTFGLGVNYGIRLNEQIKINGEDWSEPVIDTIDRTDFGLTCKLKGYYKNLFGFARYNLGLKDISDAIAVDDNGQSIGGVRQFNRNLQIGIGYRFSFEKS
ncbi:MAG: outer membrane beta-barrel protein [Bacteroidota bacterium]